MYEYSVRILEHITEGVPVEEWERKQILSRRKGKYIAFIGGYLCVRGAVYKKKNKKNMTNESI